MAACLLDSLFFMTIAQRAALVSCVSIASVYLPLPLKCGFPCTSVSRAVR